MKKRFAVILALVMALSLAACGVAGTGGSQTASAESPSSSSSDAVQQSSASSAPPSSQSAPASSQPASSTPSASSSQPAELPWWKSGLARDKLVPAVESCSATVSRYYIYDDQNKTACNGYGLFAASAGSADGDLSLLLGSAAEVSDLGARVLPDNFYEIDTLDDTKYTVEFYEKGVSLTRSLPGEGKGESVLLALDEKDYAVARQRVAELLAPAADRFLPSWLCMMRESRSTGVTFYSADATTSRSYAMSVGSWLWDELRVSVRGGGTPDPRASVSGAAHVRITFNNDLVYDLYATEDELLVTATGVATGYRYRLFSPGNTLTTWDNAARGMQNPTTGKPVIYLYPTAPTRCFVTLGYDGLIATAPEYDGGWDVTAYPDGRLVNTADGAEYPYLYWDGGKRVAWDFSAGFCVPRAGLEAFLREKLPYLGLIPSEYEEFIAYWLPRMDEYPYYVITFAGEQYERLAPLSVTPAPDSALRVHMVFAGSDVFRVIAPQALTRFARNGFAVVEWGGTDAGYFRG